MRRKRRRGLAAWADHHPKNQWVQLTPAKLRKQPDVVKEILRLIEAAYKPIGGYPNLRTPEDLLTNVDVYEGIDLDEDPEVDAVSITKKKPPGRKMVASATDRTQRAKKALFTHKEYLLNRPCHYAEVSEAMAHILLKYYKVPVVTDPARVTEVLDKDIVWVGCNPDEPKAPCAWYERTIHGKRKQKILVGIPCRRRKR